MKNTRIHISSMTLVLMLAIGLFISDPVVLATERDPYAYNEIRGLLSSKENTNFYIYSRISGLLTDLLREQKRLFLLTGRTGKNEVIVKCEGLLNEAGLYASQKDYKNVFKVMDNVHKIIMESIEQMVGKIEK